MSFKGPLFWWQVRQTRGITVVGLLVALCYVMHEPDPLRFDVLEFVPWFILIHSVLLVRRLGRSQHPTFGFLYTQGYSRDTLWIHTMLASAASVFAVWLPVAAAIWLGLRSDHQEGLRNYWFPLMEPTERPFAWWCLLAYAVLIPVFHYAWIRASQPSRGLAAGYVLSMGLMVAAFSIWNGVRVPDMPVWTIVLMAGGFAAAAVSLLIGGRRLHRRLEVMT